MRNKTTFFSDFSSCLVLTPPLGPSCASNESMTESEITWTFNVGRKRQMGHVLDG